MHSDIVIFAGPSLFGTNLDAASQSGICWAPPARRGDIDRLLRGSDLPGVIGLADGIFHAYPSVGHAELRTALQAGWTIFGLCSMGAIRAAEMAHMGLRPYGRVASMFCDDPDFSDDEVALLHGSDAPFVPLSEPLVHIRRFLQVMTEGDLITPGQAPDVLSRLKDRWYGERTLPALMDALRAVFAPLEVPSEIGSAFNSFQQFRLKQDDLATFVSSKPWLDDKTASALSPPA